MQPDDPRADVTADLDWRRLRVAIFDVDGTLYDHSRLRRRMLGLLFSHCLRHPGDLEILPILRVFRSLREELADRNATEITRRQFEEPANRLGVPVERVREVVDRWMVRQPLAVLPDCAIVGVSEFFQALRSRAVVVAVLSDYPAADKLRLLGLDADLLVTALDPEIDRLKPNPAGLLAILERTGVRPGECLMLGDRDDRDGEAARRVGMPYLLRHPSGPGSRTSFRSYNDLLADLEAAVPL